MDELKLKDAFGSLWPDEQARQRMLASIIAAQEVPESALRAQETPEGVPFAARAHRADHTHRAQRRRQPKSFSLARYAIPIAACLLLAVISPLTLSQLMSSVNEAPVAASQGTIASGPTAMGGAAMGSAADDFADEGALYSQESLESDQNDLMASSENMPASSVVETPPATIADSSPGMSAVAKTSPLSVIVFLLPILFCLIAFAIAIAAVFAWRRFKRRGKP